MVLPSEGIQATPTALFNFGATPFPTLAAPTSLPTTPGTTHRDANAYSNRTYGNKYTDPDEYKSTRYRGERRFRSDRYGQ